MDGWMDGQTDEVTDRWSDGQIHNQYESANRWTVRKTDMLIVFSGTYSLKHA
jgi:hypothetical protein